MIGVVVFLAVVVVVAAVVTDRRRPVAVLAGANSDVRVVPVLARVEGVRLLRHPLVLLSVVGVVTGFPYGGTEDWQFRWGMSGAYLFVLAMASMIVVHLAVARDGRSDTDELAASLPVAVRTRVVAHMVSLVWLLVPVCTLWALYAAVRFDGELSHSIATGTSVPYLWRPSLLELAQGPVAVAVYVLLALAAGVWWRHSAIGVVVALLLALSPLVWMFPLVVDLTTTVPHGGTATVALGTMHTFGHYLFLAGLGGFALGGALVRYGSRRLWIPVTVLGAAAVVVGAVVRANAGLG